jgi:hypothetical protein
MCVNGGDGENGVLSDVGMSVFETRSGRRKKRLDELSFPQLAKEAKGVSSNVFVGMLKIVSDTVTT